MSPPPWTAGGVDSTDPGSTLLGSRSLWCGVAGSGRARGVEDARLGVRVGDQDLPFEPVGIPEEEAQDRPEVRDEPVAGSTRHETVPDGLERLERGGLQPEVVD